MDEANKTRLRVPKGPSEVWDQELRAVRRIHNLLSQLELPPASRTRVLRTVVDQLEQQPAPVTVGVHHQDNAA